MSTNTFVMPRIFKDTEVVFTGKWLTIVKPPNQFGRKTFIFHIYGSDTFLILGVLKWFGKWRKYGFFPSDNTVFEEDCLHDIETFLIALKEDRKKNKK